MTLVDEDEKKFQAFEIKKNEENPNETKLIKAEQISSSENLYNPLLKNLLDSRSGALYYTTSIDSNGNTVMFWLKKESREENKTITMLSKATLNLEAK